MKHRTIKRLFALMLALVLSLSLCACGVNPQELLDLLGSMQANGDGGSNSTQTDPEPGGATRPGKAPAHSGTAEGGSAGNGTTSGRLPQDSGLSEGGQSLARLREMYELPDVMFGAAYLGYVEGPVEAGSSQWLWEVNETMVQQYPFIAEIDADHIIGSGGSLYCIVPQDENATLSVNRIQWNGKTGAYEVTEVLYRAETGEPVLLFANLDGVAYESDTEIFITDNSGNTCQWEPSLDAMSYLVPCVWENGNHAS